MVILTLLISYALAADDLSCQRVTSLDKTADLIEGKAREKDGELCAGAAPSDSFEDQTKLLGLIRDQAVSRLDHVKPTDFNAKVMRENHVKMRALQALRQSELGDSPNGIRLAPAVALKGVPGLPKPDGLRPSDAEVVQRAYKAELDAINAKLVSTTGLARRKLITELATPLQTRIREAGEVGYNELVSANPELLFAPSADPTDADLGKAHAKYFEEVRKTADTMRKMEPSPDGDALGLVFFGPATKDTLKTHPELCGSYQALLARARRSEKFRAFLNAGVGIAAGGTCLISGFLSAGALTSACFALTFGEFGVASTSAAASYREREILYGGLMQGASAADYEKKYRESQNYLVAAGLSGAGALGSVAGVRSALIATEREKTIETAHLIGKGEIGRDGTAARVGNYTKDQIRRKIEELKRSRFISRDERKDLIRSGRVGIDNPEAMSLAENHIALLKMIERTHLDDKSLARLEVRLGACVKSSIGCNETFKAINEAFERENKTVFADLERRLTAKAEETTDEKHFDELAGTLAKLSACKENPASPACRDAMSEAARHTAPPRLALQGPPPPAPMPVKIDTPPAELPAAIAAPVPALRKTLSLTPKTLKTVSSSKNLQAKPNLTRPWESSAIPSDEIDNLTFLTPENRTLLRSRLSRTLEDEATRKRRYAAEKREEKVDFTPIEDLNQTLKELLGNHVVVEAAEDKVMLTSHSRGISVTLDPTTRYFTVKPAERRFDKGGQLTLEKTETGSLRFIPRQPVGEPWATYSHFGY